MKQAKVMAEFSDRIVQVVSYNNFINMDRVNEAAPQNSVYEKGPSQPYFSNKMLNDSLGSKQEVIA